MKKFLLGTVALASMFFATSCGDEVQLNAGKENSASFTVTLDKVISSRAVGEGKQVNYLVYNVYEGDTKLYDTNKELTTFDGSATVEIENLESTKNYTIVFWAQNNTHEAYDVSDLTAVEIDYEEMTANDDKFDAFYGAFEFKAGQEGVEAKLKRPFAQINVGYKETAEGESAFKGQESSLMVAGIANTINLKTGVVGDEDELAEFTANDILTETLTAKGETYTYVSMAYVLVSKTGTNVEITFDVESLDIDAALDEVPVKCNYRTNLLGTYEAKSPTTASFDVSVDAGWDGYEEDQYFDQDGDQDDPTQQITVSDVKADVQEENVVFSATYTGIAKDDIQSAKFVCTPVASPSGVKARAAEGVVEVTANTQEEGKLTASEPLTNFEAGKSYTYTVVITPTDGEAFTSEPQGSTDDPGFTVPEEEEQPGTDPQPEPTEQTVTFDFTSQESVLALNSNVTFNSTASQGNSVNDFVFVNKDVTLTPSKGSASTDCLIFTTTTPGAYQLRVYKNSSFTIASDKVISSIVINNNAGAFSVQPGSVSSGKAAAWSGNSNSVTFTVTTNAQITSIVVTYGGTQTPGSSEDPSVDPTPTPDPTPSPATSFISDDIFTNSESEVSGGSPLSGATINGDAATGAKLGSSNTYGTITSDVVNISGNATLSFYAFGWKGENCAVDVKIIENSADEGTVVATEPLESNDAVSGSGSFTITAENLSPYYKEVKLTGLKPTSKISIATGVSGYKNRCVVAGIHLAQD